VEEGKARGVLKLEGFEGRVEVWGQEACGEGSGLECRA